MGGAAFHLLMEFPQLSKIPPQEKIHGPLVGVVTGISLAKLSQPQEGFAAGIWES